MPSGLAPCCEGHSCACNLFCARCKDKLKLAGSFTKWNVFARAVKFEKQCLCSFITEFITKSNGFFASTVLQDGVPAPGVVTEGVEHMLCMNGGRTWHRVCRVTVPVEGSSSASHASSMCTLVILARRLDMTAELADRYTIES
jgi:hypothetical protein